MSTYFDELFAPSSANFDYPPPLNGEFETTPEFDPIFYKNNVMTSSSFLGDYSSHDDGLFFARPLARSESRDNAILPGMVDEVETTVPAHLRFFDKLGVFPEDEDRCKVNNSEAESVETSEVEDEDEDEEEIEQDETSDFEVSLKKKGTVSNKKRSNGNNRRASLPGEEDDDDSNEEYEEESDQDEDDDGNATPETTDGRAPKRRQNTKTKTSGISSNSGSSLFSDGRTARKGLQSVLVRKPTSMPTTSSVNGVARIRGSSGRFLGEGSHECFLRVKANGTAARRRRVIVSDEVLEDVHRHPLLAADGKRSFVGGSSSSGTTNSFNIGGSFLEHKKKVSPPAPLNVARQSHRSRRSKRRFGSEDDDGEDDLEEEYSLSHTHQNTHTSTHPASDNESELSESQLILDQPNFLNEDEVKEDNEGYRGPVCAYALCPAPRHSSGMWKTVTPETSAGGQNWKGMIGKTFCHACWTQYRTKGTLSRKHRREINIVDTPDEVKQKFKKARYQQVIQQLQQMQ